ncbi:choline/ethanolaminephosphotransferase 1-like isoform X2 [Convolutriloba macropyga]|uniref:choline/ethanolaminephosphotransferase 1-like isoform X2 n=1 Tax=Convolutriloba macropyga TaxID=536237 RepID=UPI003F51B950
MKCPRKYTVSENMRFERFRYVLTPADVGNLKSYKYECDGKGFVEKLVDAVAAQFVVPRLPHWLSPQTLSFIGFIVHLVGAIAVMSVEKSSFAGEIPAIVSGLYMVCLFVYGMLESVNGAQARKLGCENALSYLVDHGLDAVTRGFILLSMCSLLRYGYFMSRMFILCIGGCVLTFLTHWRALTHGRFKLSKITAVEGQYLVQCLFLLNMIFGGGVFWERVPTAASIEAILDRRVELADILFVILVVFGLSRCLMELHEICVVNGRSTYAGLRTLSPVPWLLCVGVLAYLNYCIVSYFLFDYIQQFFCITIFFPMAKLTWAAIIAHMASW